MTQLTTRLAEIRAWNTQDMKGIEDITPTLEMLRARKVCISAAITSAKNSAKEFENLLAALKDAAHVLEPLVESSEYHSYGYTYDKIIAAIAKAEGGTK